MATTLITQVTGQAWFRGTDGSLTPLRQGMRIPAEAEIITAQGASVTLQPDGQPAFTMGGGREAQLSADVAQPTDPSIAAAATPADADAARVLAALQAGEDPFSALDATAAVLAGTGGDDGGSSFTRLAAIIETTTPLGLEYPRPNMPDIEDIILGGITGATDDEASPIVPPVTPPVNVPDGPTITIPDRNDIPGGDGQPPQSVPGTVSIFEGDSQVGVTGTFNFTAPGGLQSLIFSFSEESDTEGGSDAPTGSTRGVTLADLLAATADAPIIIDTDRGVLLLTGYDPASGSVSYRYISDGRQDHRQGEDGESVFDTVSITVLDNQGRSVSADFVANITDDLPEAADYVHDSPLDEGAAAVVLGDAVTLLSISGGADGLEGSLQDLVFTGGSGTLAIDASGQLVYTAPANVGTAGITDTFSYTVIDSDGDEATGQVTFTVTDTGVSEVQASKNLVADEDDIAGASGNSGGTGDLDAVLEGQLSYTLGADAIGSVTLSTANNATGLLTLDGQPVVTSWNAGSRTLTGHVQEDPADVVFTIQLSAPTNTGATYTMSLLQPVRHEGTSPGHEDNTTPFTVNVLVADADGSTASSSFTVGINDDTPVAVAPESAKVTNRAGDAKQFDLDLNVEGAIASYGADGPGTVRFDSVLHNAAALTGGQPMTSGGQPIFYTISNDGLTLVGHVGSTTGEIVFTVVLNPEAGTYSVDLDKVVDSPQMEAVPGGTPEKGSAGTSVPHAKPVLLHLPIQIVDGDGDTAAATLELSLVDDIPEAAPDANQVTEGRTLLDGNVLTNDKAGEDGWKEDGAVVSIQNSANGTENVTSGGATIEGLYGTLTIDASGNYSYQAHTKSGMQVLGEGRDIFTYTVQDGNGDQTEATLTIDINQFMSGTNDKNTITGGYGDDVILGDNGGATSHTTPGQNYNIVLLVDLSTSMSWNIDSENTSGSAPSRLELMKEALKAFVPSLADHSGEINLALIGFGTGQTTNTYVRFSVDDLKSEGVLDDLLTAIDQLSIGSGTQYTNYEAGFNQAVDWFNGDVDPQHKTADPEYENLTFFLTDGDPTRYINNQGNIGGNSTSTDQTTLQESVNAFNAVGGLSEISKVHAIGLGPAVNKSYLQFFDNTSQGGSVTADVSPSSSVIWNFNSNSNVGTWTPTGDGQSVSRENNRLVLNDGGNNNDVAAVYTGQAFTTGQNNAYMSIEYRHTGWQEGDRFTWELQKQVGGVWQYADSGTNADTNTGASSAVLMRSNIVGPGTYRYVFTVEDNTANADYRVFIDNITVNYPSGNGTVFGAGGQPEIIMTGDQLTTVLQGGTPTNILSPVSEDTLYGGDGDDILFGDVINTDNLTWEGRTLPNGSGVDALKAFLLHQNGSAPTDAELYDYLRENHQIFNVAGDTRGLKDMLYGGAGDDILFGQGGNDELHGGQGDDILYGGTGSDTLYGDEGDDILVGGEGNDVLSGGAGDDIFSWTSGDEGEVGDGRAVDTIMDFGNGHDRIDLAELLQGADSESSLEGYLHLSQSSEGDTIININTKGELGGVPTNSDQQIILEGVALAAFAEGADTSSQSDMITKLIEQGKLSVDS